MSEEELRAVLTHGTVEHVDGTRDRIGNLEVFWKPFDYVTELPAFEVNDLMGRLVDMPLPVERDHTWNVGDRSVTRRVVMEPWVHGDPNLGVPNIRGEKDGIGVRPQDMPDTVDGDLLDLAVLDAVIANHDRRVYNLIVRADGRLTAIDQADSFHDTVAVNGAVNIMQTRGFKGRPRLGKRQSEALTKFIRDARKSDSLRSLLDRVAKMRPPIEGETNGASILDDMIRRAKWMLRTGTVLSGAEYELGGGVPVQGGPIAPDEQDWLRESPE
jgi:hypothetical protein